jgi:predicted O-methyltransferase YrrM
MAPNLWNGAMTEKTMSDVDDYLSETFVGDDAALRQALDSSERAGLPPIAVSAVQGKLLHVLARAIGAKRALEIGTLGGYSAIWIGRALGPGGRLITVEIDPHHAEVARKNVGSAGLGDVVEVRVGAALNVLERMRDERIDPFDVIFIDADKRNNPRYLKMALEHAHPGSLVVIDNVVRHGSVLETDSEDPDVRGTREVLHLLATDPRLVATAMQTVGHKGHDGFAVALVIR